MANYSMTKYKTTTRSFYGKWLYKSSLNVPGVSIIRSRSLDEVIRLIGGNVFTKNKFYAKAINNADDIFKIIDFIGKYNINEDLAFRLESDNIDFYTNDPSIFKKINEKFSSVLRLCVSPKEGTESVLSDKNKILVKKFPDNTYKHRVYLQPHKVSSMTEKASMIKWLKEQEGRIRITDTVSRWFITTNWNWDRRYVLAKDEHTLLMLKLRCGEAVGHVYDYVLTDK